MEITVFEKILPGLKKVIKKKPSSEQINQAVEKATDKVVSSPYYMPNLNNNVLEQCKAKCINALRGKNPFEKVFVLEIKNNNIIKELCGDAQMCYIDKRFLTGTPVKIMHGHAKLPEGLTPPVSFQDFRLLNDNSMLREITAFDCTGQESILSKTDNYRHLSKRKFRELKKTYIKYLMNYAEQSDREKILELKKYCDSNKGAKAVRAEIAELLTNLQYKEGGIKAIDAFWKDLSEQLNLKYKPF